VTAGDTFAAAARAPFGHGDHLGNLGLAPGWTALRFSPVIGRPELVGHDAVHPRRTPLAKDIRQASQHAEPVLMTTFAYIVRHVGDCSFGYGGGQQLDVLSLTSAIRPLGVRPLDDTSPLV
jgi:hypothetical protein